MTKREINRANILLQHGVNWYRSNGYMYVYSIEHRQLNDGTWIDTSAWLNITAWDITDLMMWLGY